VVSLRIYNYILFSVLCGNCSLYTAKYNTVLRGISGVKKGEVTGSERKFHIDELRDLYSSSDIIRVPKSRRMGWAGHLASIKDF